MLAAPGLEQCVDLDWLQRRLAAALAETGRPWRRVSVMVAGDERMRALNRAHRDRDATTDVLAFESSAAGEPLEADVVVGAGEAARQAAARQHRIEQELLLYALHGVLHCAGWDDQTPQGFEAMHTEEDRILAAIGVGPTFGARRSGRTGRPEGSVRRSHSVG